MIDKTIDKLKNNWHYVALLLLLVAAFYVYSIPSQTFTNINEYDPFYHARVVRELIVTGSIPEWEFMSYWPEGMPMNTLYPHLWHYLLAVVYWITAFITTGSFAYNEQLFAVAVSWVMPFVGVFGVSSMYLLANEVRGKNAGLIAAAIFAFNGTFMYKTMFSEIEEDALGVSLLIFSLFAYVYALKRGGWKAAMFAGIALSLLLLSWRGVIYAAFLVAALALWQGIKSVIAKDYASLERITSTFCMSIIPVAILGISLNSIWKDTMYTLCVLCLSATLLIAATYFYNYRKPASVQQLPRHQRKNIQNKKETDIKNETAAYEIKKSDDKIFGFNRSDIYKVALALLIIASLVTVVVFGNYIWNQTMAGFDTGAKPIRLSSTIAENRSLSFEAIISELGYFSILGLFAILYFPILTLLYYKNPENFDMIVALFVSTSIVMHVGSAKLVYFFAPAMALAIAVLFSDLVLTSKRIHIAAPKLLALVIIALIASQAYGSYSQMLVIKDNYPIQDGWFKAMDYLETTAEDTAVLSWWDYGHWIAFLGNRHTIVDNSNIDYQKVDKVADIFTEYRGNNTAEIEARVIQQLADFKVTHIMIDRVLLHSKWGALTYIAERQCLPTKTLTSYGLEFPQLSELSVQSCGYGYTYSGEIGIAPCAKVITEDDVSYACNFVQGASVYFSEQEWQEIKDAVWPGYDLLISYSETNQLRLRVYGQPDNTIMFFKAGTRLLYDAPINYMYGFRVFFKDPGFQHHSLVQNEFVPNEEVVVYEVNYA